MLEERSIARIGYSKPIDISEAMIVITSNEDLDTKQGFPPDLLERISPHVFRMPDLVSRVRDVPNLTRYSLKEEAGSEEITQFQFQVARKLRMWAHEDMLSVRSIRNEIAELCRRSQGAELLSNPYEGKILAAIEKRYPGGARPVQARIADDLKISASSLNGTDTRLGRAWRAQVAAGKIPGWP